MLELVLYARPFLFMLILCQDISKQTFISLMIEMAQEFSAALLCISEFETLNTQLGKTLPQGPSSVIRCGHEFVVM